MKVAGEAEQEAKNPQRLIILVHEIFFFVYTLYTKLYFLRTRTAQMGIITSRRKGIKKFKYTEVFLNLGVTHSHLRRYNTYQYNTHEY